MKIYTLTLILPITTSLAFGQMGALKKVKSQVQESELLKNWKAGKAKTFENIYIYKLSGEDDGGRTNISYIPSKENAVASIDAGYTGLEARGGKIALFIDRESPKQANTDWFTITITEPSTGKEIYFIKLNPQSPELFQAGVWYNYMEIELADVPPVFNVEVFDNYTRSNYNYQVMMLEDETEQEEQGAVCTTCNR